MTREEVSLKELMESKFHNLETLIIYYHEQNEKRIKSIEETSKKNEKQIEELKDKTHFARWIQKNAGKAVILLIIFVLLVTNLSIFVTLLSNSGLGELIEIFK